jgi:hypothetical protein
VQQLVVLVAPMASLLVKAVVQAVVLLRVTIMMPVMLVLL